MPKKTTEVIIKSGNDYVIGVKNNQQTLNRKIQQIIINEENVNSFYSCFEMNKGRKELRTVWVSNCLEGITEDWIGLKQVVKIEREIKDRKGKRSETAYFISSLKGHATFYYEGIRTHWAIENGLHYVKDVTLKEDASKIRTDHAPENISTIRNIVLNIFVTNDYKNIAQAQRLVSNDIKLMKKLII